MDINRASREDLQQAFEVDGERAQYILDKRNQLGGFDSWEQIKEVVPSIEDGMVENLRAAGLTIGPKVSAHNRQESASSHDRETVSRERQEEHSSVSSRRKENASSGGSATRDVNTVSREELKRVCQIDGERAEYFMRAREQSGGFKSWEQIKDSVPSFDDGMVNRLRNAGFRIASDSKAA